MKIWVPRRFSVVRILREEANSKTLLANDHILKGSDVLVKILRKGSFCSDQPLVEQLSWFSGIRHKNIGTIFDAGLTLRGDLYYVREYLPIAEFASLNNLATIKGLISAVAFLQINNRIHGAIKPSNIFLTDKHLKLTDACFKGSSWQQTEEDIRFTAPEVLRGETHSLQSDLYSMGAVLYRLLAQRDLFEDSNRSHLRAKYAWASPLPIGNLSDVPKVVSDLVMQLLDKEPQKRSFAFTSLKDRVEGNSSPATR